MRLSDWRRQQSISKEAAGRLFGTSGVSVGRYEAGRIPDAEVMQRIIDVTEGAVQPNDFFRLPPAQVAPAHETLAIALTFVAEHFAGLVAQQLSARQGRQDRSTAASESGAADTPGA